MIKKTSHYSERRTQGLTLIELIIVISIIIILILIIIAFFRGQIFKGNDAKRKTDINRIKIAVEEYEKDHDCYPLSQFVSCYPGTGLSPYLDKIECDPVTHASYFYEYEDNVCPHWYRIYTKLDNDQDGDAIQGIGPYTSYNYYQGSSNSPVAESLGGAIPSAGGGRRDQSSGNFYGCQNSICVPIAWDPNRPGPECDPNYQNPTCYGQCGSAQTECKDWSK